MAAPPEKQPQKDERDDIGGEKTLVTKRTVLKKKGEDEIVPIQWSRVLPGTFKSAAAGGVAGLVAWRWAGRNPYLFLGTAFYSGLIAGSYLYLREVVRTSMIPDVPSLNLGFVGGALSGVVVGLMAPGNPQMPSLKQRRLMTLTVAGALIGTIGALCHDYYLVWAEKNTLKDKAFKEKQQQRFKEDKERLGDKAYDIHRRETVSSMPSWWPIKAVSDDEYEKILENKMKILERKRLLEELDQADKSKRESPTKS